MSNEANTAKLTRILRRREVERLTGLGRSSIYQRMADGTFPLAIPLGPKPGFQIEVQRS